LQVLIFGYVRLKMVIGSFSEKKDWMVVHAVLNVCFKLCFLSKFQKPWKCEHFFPKYLSYRYTIPVGSWYISGTMVYWTTLNANDWIKKNETGIEITEKKQKRQQRNVDSIR